ncbi:MAG TPA: T9SS type A sorting domain-containing protein, partial [Bacteroidia bacterium]|nr:T9SS type A sorting domain-containing protein [Bacteroidia bacterium]
GSGALTFSWSDGQANDTAVGLCPGVYTCTVTDTANCTSTGTFVLTTMPPPLANSTYTDASCDTCCDGTAVANASGGSPPYSYLWSDNQTTDTATGLCSGKYFVCITDANGCSYCDTIEVGFISGIFSPGENAAMKIYPNSATDEIYFPKTALVELIDLSGKIILEEKNCSMLNVAELAPGIYFLNLYAEKGNVMHGKFIKN